MHQLLYVAVLSHQLCLVSPFLHSFFSLHSFFAQQIPFTVFSLLAGVVIHCTHVQRNSPFQLGSLTSPVKQIPVFAFDKRKT